MLNFLPGLAVEPNQEIFRVFQALQDYVDWTEEDRQRVLAAAPLITANFQPLIEDFYDAISKRPVTSAILTGDDQIARLKESLRVWLEQLVAGRYDVSYVRRRIQVGFRHVEIGLPQVYTSAALSRLRAGLMQLLSAANGSGESSWATAVSLNKLLDLDLAIIQHAYEQEYVRQEKLEAREHSEAKFRELVNSAECMIVILHQDGSIAYISPYGESLTGYRLEDVEGDDYCRRFLDEQQAEEARDNHAEVWLGTSLSGYQYDIICRDGSRRSLIWNTRKLEGNDEPAMLFSVGHDITSLLDAQSKTLQSERLAAIGQTSTGLAHESRNALQRIQAGVDLLELEVEQNEDAMAILAQIQSAQNHLRHLFDEVRGYASDIILDLSECSLQAILRESWELLQPAWADRDVTLHEEPSDADVTCIVDHFRMVQVFRNLLENALAAGEDPVRIEIRRRAVRLDDAHALEVSIRDNGPGFNDRDRKRIFSPFFTTKPKGTGLGMAIAQRTVEAHHGRISIGDPPHGGEVLVVVPTRTDR